MTRLTIRARLTLLYGGVFLLGGVVLLAATYVLVAARLPHRIAGLSDAVVRIKPTVERDPGTGAAPLPKSDLRDMLFKYEQNVRDNTLESLLTQGSIALVLVTAAAVGFGWLLAGRALQPLHEITGTARRIATAGTAGAGLHERIALDGPIDEVRELADTFDTMLERLDRSFDGQRRLVANASHELRTPLAINRSLLELALTRPGASPDVKQLAESLLTVNERHERLIDGLLTLADSENQVTQRSPVDLAEVAEHVCGLAAGTARQAGVRLTRDLAPAPTSGDPILLERLVHNLVENAIRHNVADGGWLSVRTRMVDGRATVLVENSGPVVPGYEVETLFQPFRRLDRERTGNGRGFGLGLSIVRAVARSHGGDATAYPRAGDGAAAGGAGTDAAGGGGGLTVTVTVPSS